MALIIGISGFVGSHMAEFLLRNNVEVVGTIRLRSRIDHIKHLKDIQLIECELRDPVSVEKLIKELKPDLIFHLAAQSFVPASWNSPLDTIYNNISGQVNIMEALRQYHPNCKLQIACSSEVPIKETNPLRPLSPYAVSKVAQDYLGYQYPRWKEGSPVKRIISRRGNATRLGKYWNFCCPSRK